MPKMQLPDSKENMKSTGINMNVYHTSMVKLRHQVIHGKQQKAKLRKRKTRASREK